jgi:hypothetical protein
MRCSKRSFANGAALVAAIFEALDSLLAAGDLSLLELLTSLL